MGSAQDLGLEEGGVWGVCSGPGSGGGGERVTRAYTVEVQTASVFYAQSLILLLFEPWSSQAWTHYISCWSGTLYR